MGIGLGLDLGQAFVDKHVFHLVGPGQMVGLFFPEEIAHGVVDFPVELTDLNRRFVKVPVGFFNFFQNRSKAGHHGLGLLPAFTIKPLTKTALVIVGFDIQLVDMGVGEQGVNLVGPVEMIHLLLGQVTVKFVPADHLTGIGDDPSHTGVAEQHNHTEQGQHDAEPRGDFFADGHVFPVHFPIPQCLVLPMIVSVGFPFQAYLSVSLVMPCP